MGKVKIHKFKNLSNYQICGGIIHLKWEVSDALCIILISSKFLQFFTKTTEIKLLTNRPQKYSLIALGLFSISKRTIWSNPVKLNSDKKKFKKISSGKISIDNLKNKKISPIIRNSFPKKIKLKIKEIRP
tara:strand:- start:2159 stop:2548 length:390 start_codon:yes stop_codon:yes gene_type:complete